MRGRKIKVHKFCGMWVWECQLERCPADDKLRSGASMFWEIANHQADLHARGWHRKPKSVPRDYETPPGGSHFDWSDTGMHVKVIAAQRDAQS